VFIVGMPRSGTTLAEHILASHPAVFGAGELPFWSDVSALLESRREGDQGSGRAPAAFAASAEFAAAAAAAGSAAFAADYLRELDELSPAALRVVDKMPANFLSLGVIHEALPNARILHLRRNPLDTCLSIYFQHFRAAHSRAGNPAYAGDLTYASDLDDIAHYYVEYLRLMAHWRRVLPEHAMLDVPYEALVGDQETWSRRMLAFIGIPWDPRCLDFHETHRSVMSASKWQVRQKMSRASIERWRNYEKFVGSLRALEGGGVPDGAPRSAR
jgi:hypothetical protein